MTYPWDPNASSPGEPAPGWAPQGPSAGWAPQDPSAGPSAGWAPPGPDTGWGPQGPSAGWAAPGPDTGWAPPVRPPSAYRVPATVARTALAAGAAGVGAALAVAYAAALVIGLITSGVDAGSVTSALPGIGYLGAWLFGLGLGAPLVAEGGQSAGFLGAGSYQVTFYVPVPLVLAAAVATAAALTVRSQRREPLSGWRPVPAAVGIAAAVPFAVGIVVALVSRVSLGGSFAGASGQTSIGVAIFRGGLMPAVVVALTVLVARVAAGGLPLPDWARRLDIVAVVRAVADYLVLTAAVMSVAVLVVWLVEEGVSSPAAVFGVWALTLPALGLLVTELAAFSPYAVSGTAAGAVGSAGGSAGDARSLTLYGGAVPGWLAVLLVIPVIGVVVAGLRFTLRRSPAPRAPWAAAAVGAVTMVVLLAVANEYLAVSFIAGGQASTAFGSGAGVVEADVRVGGLGYLSAAVVGALIPLVGWLLAPWLYRSAPGVLRAALWVPFPARRALAALAPRPAAPMPPAYQPSLGTAPMSYGVPMRAPLPPAYQPPPGTAPTPHPATLPGAAGPPRQRRVIAVIAVVVAAVVVAAVVLTVVLTRRDDTSPLAGRVAPVGTGNGGSLPSSSVPQFPSSSAAAPTPTSPPDPSPMPSAPPTVSPGGIDLSAVAGNPATPPIATMLDIYFGGINAHNGALAASVFDPSGAVNPSDPSQVTKFNQSISTTNDSGMVISSITGDPVQGYLVAMSFRSTQAGQYGPVAGQTCTNWQLTYEVTAAVKLVRARNVTHTAC